MRTGTFSSPWNTWRGAILPRFSPERLTRSEVDQQSDLWAVGATLYEMLAGVPPFRADSTRKLETLIRSGRPPRALPVSCPRGLRAIVSKALSAEPDRRYGSAYE